MEREELRREWMTLALGLAAIATVGAFAVWMLRRPRGREFGMGCLRCSGCGVSWPSGKDYQPCPECLRRTDSINDDPIDAAEAHSRLTHARFERWLDEHDRRHLVEQLERIPVKDGT